jgi:CubicO group peptidase (beta-lactamase class C family)
VKHLSKNLLLVAPLLSAAAFSQTSLDLRLSVLDPIVNDAIAQRQIPGAVLVVGHDGQVVYRKAYGDRALEPRREAMTVDTVFDCASLTKVVATTTAIMQLWELGKFRMNDPVAKYLPEFAQNGKAGYYDPAVAGALLGSG